MAKRWRGFALWILFWTLLCLLGVALLAMGWGQGGILLPEGGAL